MKPLETVTVQWSNHTKPYRMLFYGFGVKDGTTAALVSDIDCPTGFSISAVNLRYVKFNADPQPLAGGEWTITDTPVYGKACVTWVDEFHADMAYDWATDLLNVGDDVHEGMYYATHPKLTISHDSVPRELRQSFLEALRAQGLKIRGDKNEN